MSRTEFISGKHGATSAAKTGAQFHPPKIDHRPAAPALPEFQASPRARAGWQAKGPDSAP